MSIHFNPKKLCNMFWSVLLKLFTVKFHMLSRLEQSSAINDLNKKTKEIEWMFKKNPKFYEYCRRINQVVEWAVKLFVNSIFLHVLHDKQLINKIGWTLSLETVFVELYFSQPKAH